MSAVNVDQVSVLRRADAPAHFLWQGRLYAVRAVRAHWFEPFQGRADQQGVPVEAVSADRPELTGLPSLPVRGADDTTVVVREPVGGPDAPDTPGDDRERAEDRELWRVEAAAGRTARTGVFDLCVAWPAGRWTLTQVEES